MAALALLQAHLRDTSMCAGEQGAQRRVPQHMHPHVLLIGGANAVEKLVPGFQEDCIAAGAVMLDFLNSVVKVLSAFSPQPLHLSHLLGAM